MSHENPELPYGIGEVQATARPSKAGDKSVKCFVVGCQHRLRVPSRTFPGDVCPDHGIRCHYSSNRPTYSYLQPRRNIIASADMFTQQIVRHPFKFESHRLGSERSEDALYRKLDCCLRWVKCLRASHQAMNPRCTFGGFVSAMTAASHGIC